MQEIYFWAHPPDSCEVPKQAVETTLTTKWMVSDKYVQYGDLTFNTKPALYMDVNPFITGQTNKPTNQPTDGPQGS